ncbi:hypothetical protein NL676_014765 [Syzygium grande]|nr:hypothetical protein NL676_014765 [Syzygium grande]
MLNNQSSQSPRRADFTFDHQKNEDPQKNLDTTARANPINSRKKIEPLPGQATAEKVDPANEFATKRSGASKREGDEEEGRPENGENDLGAAAPRREGRRTNAMVDFDGLASS